MWLFCSLGHFSVVEKPDDTPSDSLTVRARRPEDLDALRSTYLPSLGPTQFDSRADYAYRARVPRAAFAESLALLAHDIHYSDFKSHVEATQGSARAVAYHEVWAAMRRFQQPIPVIYASIGRRADVLDDDDDGHDL